MASDEKKAQEALRESENRYHNLFSSMIDGFAYCKMIYDDKSKPIDFVYLEVNDAFERLTGLRRENVVGRKVSEAIPGTRESNPEIFDKYGKVAQTGVPERFELFFKPLSQWFDIAVNSPRKDYFVAVFENITERKKAEKELRQALEKAKNREAEISALLVASKSVLQNRSFKSSARVIFDSCKELLGATSGYVALLSDDGKDNIVLFLESGGLSCTVDHSLPMPIRGLRALAYNTGKATVENQFECSEWASLLPNGHVNLQNVLFSPLKIDARTVGIMGLANKPGGFTEHDAEIALLFGDIASIALINSNMIDMLEQNQKKLTEYSENLEGLVEEESKKLKDSERLAAIGATAAMIGHDIRNPLQAMIGDIYLLKDYLIDMPEMTTKNDVAESLEQIEKNIGYINKIIADLQDYSRAIVPELCNINLYSLVVDAFRNIEIPENLAPSIEIDSKIDLKTDCTLLTRILTNLIVNAIQAMPKGGKLSILASQKQNNVVLSVEDTGVGIPEHVKPKLFTPMMTTKSKGQGLGLAVVKRLVDALNGDIAFESEEGKGTKFTIELPINK